MNEIIGFFLISIAIVFFVTFLVGDSLNAKEKVKLALSIIAFLSIVIIGACFLSNTEIFN